MSYWHQMYPRPNRERVEVENGAERFEALLAKELGEKDRSFAESLANQHQANGNLSPKQVECFERMEQRYSDEAVKARNEWTAIYAAEHRETALIVAKYYRTTQYFSDLASNILLDENFVPTQRQFEAITKNKYAKKAIATATEPHPSQLQLGGSSRTSQPVWARHGKPPCRAPRFFNPPRKWREGCPSRPLPQGSAKKEKELLTKSKE